MTNYQFDNPLIEMLEESKDIARYLESASQELQRRIVTEADARAFLRDSDDVYQEYITELVAEAVIAAQAGDESSPLYKVAVTSKAWSIIADYIPLQARQTDAALQALYRDRERKNAAHRAAAAELERAQVAFKEVRAAAELRAAALRCAALV